MSSLDMACPADKFRPASGADDGLEQWAPQDLEPGTLWRTLPCPIPPGEGDKLQGVRLAGPQPLPPASLVIQGKVSSRGGIQVARQRIHVGLPHAGRIVTIELGDTSLHVIDPNGELLTIVPRDGNGEISRFKAHGSKAPDDGRR